MVIRLIGLFRAEVRAGIDRGERDLHSEPDRGGIPRDFGTTNFKRKKGKEARKGHYVMCAQDARGFLFSSVFLVFLMVSA